MPEGKLFGVPIGSDEYERMIDYIRADQESGMMYTKMEMAVRKIIESRGGNFDEEFTKWKEKGL